MSVVVNEVRAGTYLDSVALMRMAQTLARLPGIEEAGLMIGTPANRDILREAGVLGPEGERAGPGDLIVAVRARDAACAHEALGEARRLLDQRRAAMATGAGATWRPRSLRTAHEALPDANLALISVPGDFAAVEAMNALRRGLNVMIFSDNVPLADEIALKRQAQDRGLLVMGPDCGTAIIAGTPIAFANAVPRGDVGIIGASGTGIQEVSCLVARAGRGISHALGTGGRDLTAEVGGITTLMAFDLLDADPETREIVILSKPPAPEVAARVLARAGRSAKPVTVSFLGLRAGDFALPANVRFAHTLAEAAAVPRDGAGFVSPYAHQAAQRPRMAPGRRIAGLYGGGTLAAEAQFILASAGLPVASNAPIPGVPPLASAETKPAHRILDLGDDAFTRGRPHPMLEPAVRDAPLKAAAADPDVAALLLDVVLGFGAHRDPAGHLRDVVVSLPRRPLIFASVTGTDADPQVRRTQVACLEAAGVRVAPSNAAAVEAAIAAVS